MLSDSDKISVDDMKVSGENTDKMNLDRSSDESSDQKNNEKKRNRSGGSGGPTKRKKKRELINIWVKVGEDGGPEEVSVEPNSTVSKLKKEIRKNEEFYHLLYFEGEPVPIQGLTWDPSPELVKIEGYEDDDGNLIPVKCKDDGEFLIGEIPLSALKMNEYTTRSFGGSPVVVHVKSTTGSISLSQFDILEYINSIDLPRRGDSDAPTKLIPDSLGHSPLLLENPSKNWLNEFKTRRNIPKVEAMSEEERREAFQLICIGASPGSGKSTFLDSLARIDDRYIEDEVLSDMYRKTWFIHLSLNGWSEYVSEFGDAETSLSIRLLYSHFFLIEENLKDTFKSFRANIPSDYRLNIENTVKKIESDLENRNSDKKYIVILVDELNEPRLRADPVLLIRSLCNLVNNEIDVCFTSLETVYIDASVTDSGRLLHWITLCTPTPDVVIQLFEEVNIQITDSVRIAILYMCTNWRCVSILATLLLGDEELIHSPSMFRLESELLKKLKKVYRTKIITDHVVQSILAKPMDTSEAFTDKCVRSGVYMSPIIDNTVIPKMNYILLVDWADQNPSNALAEAISLMVRGQEISRFSPEKYEIFHGYWECARRYAFLWNDQEKLKISELYNDKGIRDDKFENVTIVLNPEYRTNAHVASIDDVQLVYDVIYVIGGNNPGFDACVFHKTLSGKTILICIQNKYSGIDTSDPVYTDREIREGINKTVLLIEDHIEKFNIKHLYFVGVACRRYSDTVLSEINDEIQNVLENEDRTFKVNVLLLSQTDLMDLYCTFKETIF